MINQLKRYQMKIEGPRQVQNVPDLTAVFTSILPLIVGT